MIGSIRQMMNDMKAGVFDMTNDGVCSNCGECCSDILPISLREVRKIKKYIKAHGIKEVKHCYPTAQPIIDLKCPFRNDTERKCNIYEVRPRICQDFKCDNPRKGIKPDMSTYDKDILLVSMRGTFYGETK